jgi:hypothetical protein
MPDQNQGRELSWDDTIQNDGASFQLLPEGDYPFTVKKFERARHGGSAKLPPCNKAVLTLEVDGGELGPVTVETNLFLHTKTEGLVCNFFRSIGQRRHGDKQTMNWNAVPGSAGRCRIRQRTWVGNRDGKEHQSNEVDRFLDPPATAEQATEPAAEPAAAGFVPGSF